MKKHAIAVEYGAFLQEAKELATFFSGKNWAVGSEHEPGLTQLEILSNALALVCERYEEALAESGLFVEKSVIPELMDTFLFDEDATAHAAKTFSTQPAGREELCEDIESLPGVRRAWVFLREGKEEPEMRVEFLPVLDMGEGEEAFALDAQTMGLAHTQKRKQNLLEKAATRCRHLRGVGQPPLKVREVRFAPLEGDLSLSLPKLPDKAVFPSLAAKLLLAAEDCLRPRGKPRPLAAPHEMNAFLSARLAEEGMRGACVTVRLFAPGKEAKAQGEYALAEEEDAFAFLPRHIRIFSGTSRVELSPEEKRQAEYFSRLAQLAQKRPLSKAAPEKQPRALHVEEPKLHEQFPQAYRLLDKTIEDAVRQGEVRQLQGWLLLFEQLLADALSPLKTPQALFAPFVAKPETWFAVEGGALQSLLTPKETYKAGVREAVEEGGFSLHSSKLLLHLAALQGEEAWFNQEAFAAGGFDEAHGPKLLAYWLRHLPWLNGCRLGAGHAEFGMPTGHFPGLLSPLEARLSMLLLPYRGYAPLVAHNFFDIRATRNEVTGQEEYRCYIRDEGRKLRMLSLLAGQSPAEAARAGMLALHFARIPEHYHRTKTGIKISWVAALVEEENAASDAVRIRETVAWAERMLPCWLRILEYPLLGAAHACEALLLVEEEAVPPEWRADFLKRVEAQTPAHLLLHVVFLSAEERRKAELLLHASTQEGNQEGRWSHHQLTRFCEEKMAEAARHA